MYAQEARIKARKANFDWEMCRVLMQVEHAVNKGLFDVTVESWSLPKETTIDTLKELGYSVEVARKTIEFGICFVMYINW